MVKSALRALLGAAAVLLMVATAGAGCLCQGSLRGDDSGTSPDGGVDAGLCTCDGICCAAGDLCLGSPGICCAPDDACGGTCCGTNEVCEAGACHVDCGMLLPCGDAPEECCTAAEVCYVGSCITPGAPCDELNPCPDGEYCEVTLGQCLPNLPGGGVCEYQPPPGSFAPTIEWEWTGSTAMPSHNQVMMAPMVVDLDLDGIPDIVFNTFTGSNYGDDGVLRAIRGDGSGELWTVTDPAYRTIPGSGIALGDIDGDGFPEVVTCKANGGNAGPVIVFEHDGSHKWTTTSPDVYCGWSAPSIGDLFQDGSPEIVVRYAVIENTGTALWANRVTSSMGGANNYSALSDVDGDGYLDVVGGNVAYDRFGGIIWERTDLTDGYIALADLSMDGLPDVVSVVPSEASVIALDGFNGITLWGPVDINQGVPTPSGPNGGGPPTIADFDGDTLPEVAAAGGYGYVVFEHDGTPKWFMPTQDLSSRVTGSSVFDFDGDGMAEVVYSDELTLWVYAGVDGTVLVNECATSGTLWEYPLVVDVDADDHAEIVTMTNNYAFGCIGGGIGTTGIQVRGDLMNNWVRTRTVWNEHTYHVTNVNEDGTIPVVEVSNAATPGLNNFRQNVQPDGLLNAPDLALADLLHTSFGCPAALALSVRVINQGSSGAPAPIPVAFYEELPVGSGMLVLLDVAWTTVDLLPGQSEVVSVTWPIPAGREADTFFITAVANDDGTGVAVTSLVHECDELNNAAGPLLANCLLK